MNTLSDLQRLVQSTTVNFNDAFLELHHFSKRPPFATKPLGFDAFVNYCESLSQGINQGQENERTIQRAYRYLTLVGSGHSEADSMSAAWSEFPLATRGE